ENRRPRLLLALLVVPFALLVAAPALAVSFTVHGYELGERITLTSGRQVYTAQLDVTLESTASHVASYCVDLDTHIGVGTYDARAVLDAFSDASPVGEAPRNLAWAGHVMSQYGHDIDALVGTGLTRQQAITGVQAAIWEGIYGGGVVNASSLSTGARALYRQILASTFDPTGEALVVDLVRAQDQVIDRITPAVPEPSAALVFAVGLGVSGAVLRPRRKHDKASVRI
ncbi:MAG TPA: hypothetical protein PLW10_15080, partial [Myxococcota bacterium]|nr:hypothetical protein [Myxococcota bacterium]